MAIILNLSSGPDTEDDVRRDLEKLLREHNIDAKILPAHSGAQIEQMARQAIDEGCERLVAAGGDGTVNAVASLVAGTDMILGVLPMGTLNHFARDLGIAPDLEKAVKTLGEGKICRIDAGEVNGKLFINNSSLGLYPSIVRHREQQQERLGRSKWLALAWASLVMFGRYPYLHVRLVVDGKDFTTSTPLVFIGNNDYELRGFDIGRRAKLDDGKLAIYIPHKVGRFGMIRLTIRALMGRLREADEFNAMEAREVVIETRRKKLRVALDGEVIPMHSPLRYRICQKALNVIVPAEPDGGA